MNEMPIRAAGAPQPSQAEFRVGHVFSRAGDIFTANFLRFIIVGAVIALPNLLIGTDTVVDPRMPGLQAFLTGGRGPESILLPIVLNMIAQAMILYIAFPYVRGQPTSLDAAVQNGLARLLSIIGLIIVVWLGAFFGFILLVIPCIILMIISSVAMPACVVETLGPFASLKRSSQLTKGHRWKIFGIFILMWVVSLVVGLLIQSMANAFGSALTLLVNFAWSAVWYAYYNSILVMIYYDLRVAKEGVDAAQIAAVFD